MPSGHVDLRSDTVTRPTAEMRRAMADAEVGDDCYGEDPTVNALQEEFAARVGKEAAVFVPSGTMGNQVAIRLQAPPGTLVVAARRAHVVVHEHGGAARNTGAQVLALDDDDGTISAERVTWAIEAGAHHQPSPSLVCIENTHMPSCGSPWAIDRLSAVSDAARAGGLRIHLDGARLFNAEVATGTSAARYAAAADTVMCCLSKGLSAPVGSLLGGTRETIAAARDERAVMGGGMRQAGVLAAAGRVALSSMVDRLAEDHARARVLADAVAERWPASLDPTRVRTNIVVFEHAEPGRVLAHLGDEGVLAGTIAPRTVRLVTHADIDDDGVERARKALATAP